MTLAPLLMLAACGGSGGSPPSPTGPAEIGTLAYVVSGCHEDAHNFSLSQSLQILRGDREPITVAEFPSFGRLPALGLCPLFTEFRVGVASVLTGAFQRLGVSPDGSGVIFEATFDFTVLAMLGVRDPLPPDQKGIFYVAADGTGLRRLGPASGAASNQLVGTPGVGAFSVFISPFFEFSPDGRLVTFSDIGPGPDGEDAIQIVTLDVASGRRTQLTHLPATARIDSDNPAAPATFGPIFIDARTVAFISRTNPDGLNPGGDSRTFTIKTDGSGLSTLPSPVVLPGSKVLPVFSITGPATNVFTLAMPGDPVNPNPMFPGNPIQEVFLLSGKNLLQLTAFRRIDTFGGNLSTDSQRVFFAASADPTGANPLQNCQIFSVDTLAGEDMRQITRFGTGEPSEIGCFTFPGAGCYVAGGFGPVQDAQTGTLIFDSSCDPFDTNPNGEQTFAMRPDGTGLRQLTDTRGVSVGADGSVDAELPGPQAYSIRVEGF